MSSNQVKALRQLIRALVEYSDDRETSVPDEPRVPDSIEAGDSVHNAVVEVESYYGGKLPISGSAWETWRHLLLYSRGKGRGTAFEQANRTYDLADQLREWAESEIARLTGGPAKDQGGNSLLDRLADILTPRQYKIVKHLWGRSGIGFDTLAKIPGCFRDVPSDEAIIKALKRTQDRLNAHPELGITVSFSQRKRRATLNRSPDK